MFQIDYLKNPRGLITSGMFNATVFTYDWKRLFNYNSIYGPNVTMYNVALPQNIGYNRSSVVNGERFNLTMDIYPTNYVNPGDYVVITLPRPIFFSDQTKCEGAGYWVSGPLKCNFTGDLTSVNVSLSVTGRYRRLESGRHLF